MNKYILVLISIVLITEFSCKKDFEYPLIQTGEVTDIDSTGVVFHGKILDIGNTGISDYGFVWGTNPHLDIDSSKISFANIDQTGVFSCIITNDLVIGKRYYVKAFAKNEEYITYGQTVSFESLGSIAPSIINFTPKSGDEDDIVTIYGDNFTTNINNVSVYFGDMIVQVDSASKTKLVVKLPSDISVSGLVEIKCIVSNQETVAEEKFNLEGVTILDFYPKELYGSDTIYIECKDLSLILHENDVKIDNRDLELISLTGNTLEGLIYYNENSGEKQITITVNGKTCSSIENLSVLPTWETVCSDYTFIRNRSGVLSLSIDNKAYLGTGYNQGGYKDMWCYDPNTNNWSQRADFPCEHSGIEGLAGFTINSKGYAGLGQYAGLFFYNSFYEYDPIEDIWTQKTDFPGEARRNSLGIALGNYGYVGLGGGIGTTEMKRDFWRYNPVNDSWTQLYDFPEIINSFDMHGVQNKNKAYIVIEGYDYGYLIYLWEYDPVIDSWLKLPNVPAPYDSNLSVVFATENYLIFGFDRYGTREFWKYHIETQTFIRIADNPGEPESPVPFHVNRKTYITSKEHYYTGCENEALYKFNPDW